MQFSDIVSYVKKLSNVRGEDALIKEAIQMGLDRATAKDLPYLMTPGFITTVAPYETGTVSVTNNSTTVTGSGTTFTSAMVGRKIRVNTDNAYYRISAFVSATEITLEAPYQGSTDSGLSYSIYKDEYRLPSDLDTYKVIRQIEESVAMVDIEATAFDVIEPTPESEGSPNYSILAGTKLDTYSTGTISGTVATSTITGSGTSWTDVEGLTKGSKLTQGSNVYTVKSVDSDTQITIYETLKTTISAGSTYSILLDNLIMQIYDIPDAVENLYFRYQRIAFPLINDQDIPDLPDQWHWLLIHAGLSWAFLIKDKEEALRQQKLFEAGIEKCWGRIGHVSSARRYPRRSQDDIMVRRRFFGPRLPAGYGRTYVF